MQKPPNHVHLTDNEIAVLISIFNSTITDVGDELYVTQSNESSRPHRFSPSKAAGVIQQLARKDMLDYFDPGPNATIRLTEKGAFHSALHNALAKL